MTPTPHQTVAKPKHLDLFSGIGGFSFAAEACGFETIAFSETDKDASLVLDHLWPETKNIKDIKKLCRRSYDCEQPDEDTCHCPRCNTEFGDCECIGTDEFTDTYGFPDLVTGGVPCQPASALGQMRGTSDERWLWPEAIRIMRELRPRFGVFENPPSLLVLEGGRAWNGIVSGLVALGYDCWWDVFPAAAFGAGHLRERLILTVADAMRERLEERQREDWQPIRGGCSESGMEVTRENKIGTATNANGARLQGHAGHGADGDGRTGAGQPTAPPDLRGRVSCPDWWHEANTGVPVLADGLPAKLVEAACRCAGNSVVPQVLMPILESIRATLP